MINPKRTIGKLKIIDLRHLAPTAVLIVGLLFIFFLIIVFPRFSNTNSYAYMNSLIAASTGLTGKDAASDIAQDFIGFRGLVLRSDSYPILKNAAPEIGLVWDAPHSSTHPPTTFIFTAPVAFLPWRLASTIWGWLMLTCIGLSYRLFGFNWRLSIGLAGITLLWPPAAFSIQQVTPLWLLFSALAFRFRARREFASGIAIGLGAMVKIFPVILLVPSILKRNWRAILGSLLVGVLFLVILLALNPAVFSQYIEANRIYSISISTRCENASLYISLTRLAGNFGVVVFSLLLFTLLIVNRALFRKKNLNSTETWMLLIFLSVALLPLLWISSLLPLLPVMIWLFTRNKPIVAVLCLLGLLTSTVFPIATCQASYITALSVLLIGSAFSIWTIISDKNKKITFNETIF